MGFLIHHWLERSAERSPDKEASVDGDRRLSYRELQDLRMGLPPDSDVSAGTGLESASNLPLDRFFPSLEFPKAEAYVHRLTQGFSQNRSGSTPKIVAVKA
jgi:hypothetical protein